MKKYVSYTVSRDTFKELTELNLLEICLCTQCRHTEHKKHCVSILMVDRQMFLCKRGSFTDLSTIIKGVFFCFVSLGNISNNKMLETQT